MKSKTSFFLIFLLICLSTLYLVFALRTNTYFSLDDFALLNYLQNHTTFEMVTQFLSQGDIWGFKKILGYLNFSFIFKVFGVNPTAFMINNHLFHTGSIILTFLISRYLTKDLSKSFFIAVLSNSLYLFYFSNIHEYLVTLLILLGVYTHLKFPKKTYLSIFFFILSLLTKEIAFTLPFLFLSLNIFLRRKTDLKPFFLILATFIFYQFFLGPTKTNLSLSHPYANRLSLVLILSNLKYYLPIWLPILSFTIPILFKKLNTLPLFMVSLLSLLPALLLVNRQETYYLYLPTFYFAIYLSIILPKFKLKTLPIFLLTFFLLGGRKILPPIAKQNFPNWQKVSIQNVINKVENNLSEKEISLDDIYLERDAKLMLGSDTLNLFVNKTSSSGHKFVYNPDTQTVHILKE